MKQNIAKPVIMKDTAMKKVCLVSSVIILLAQIQTVLTDLHAPEFTEPIKNITTSEGSNVELSCYVRHLGNYRVIWLKKEGEKEHFVAINSLKITKNPRITVTVMQTSDDVTQSNVYIRNAEEEDTGKFECAVNTNPMISQIGDLEVTKPVVSKALGEEESLTIKNDSGPHQLHPVPLVTTPSEFTKEGKTEVDISSKITGESNDDPGFASTANEAKDSDVNGTSVNGNVTLCSDMKSVWDEATDSIKDFLKNFVNSLVNFTCSFLSINS